MRLFGPVHLSLVVAIAAAAILLALLCRRRPSFGPPLARALGCALAVNEIAWWIFRYSHEGFRFPQNVPLQLCDLAGWVAVAACLTRAPLMAELTYLGGFTAAAMAILTPDLWSPWPSWPAIYFFLSHGGIVIAAAILIYGRLVPLRRGAVWRTFGVVLGYALIVGTFDGIFHVNYMYLCSKPRSSTLLNAMGPWPVYLFAGAALALFLFWLLWLGSRFGRNTVSSPISGRNEQTR